MFRNPEQAALNVIALLGAVAVFVGLLMDSLILRDIGSILIAVGVLFWGVAHLAGREWTRQTSFGQGRFMPIAFIVLGILILFVIVGGWVAG